jgi:hypothetical protein
MDEGKESRDGWPLLTVETVVNGYSFVVPVLETFFLAWLLWSVVSPVQNIFPSPYTISFYLFPFAQQPRQTVVQGRLSLNVCPRA